MDNPASVIHYLCKGPRCGYQWQGKYRHPDQPRPSPQNKQETTACVPKAAVLQSDQVALLSDTIRAGISGRDNFGVRPLFQTPTLLRSACMSGTLRSASLSANGRCLHSYRAAFSDSEGLECHCPGINATTTFTRKQILLRPIQIYTSHSTRTADLRPESVEFSRCFTPHNFPAFTIEQPLHLENFANYLYENKIIGTYEKENAAGIVKQTRKCTEIEKQVTRK